MKTTNLVRLLVVMSLPCSIVAGAGQGCDGSPGLGGGGSTSGPSVVHASVSSSASGIVTGTGGAMSGFLGARCVVLADGGDAGESSDASVDVDAAADADTPLVNCGGGLSCLDSTSNDPVFGGGPPGGFCTKACLGDMDCAPVGGVCYTLDPAQPGRCTLSCTIGAAVGDIDELLTAPEGELDAGKCLGRPDLRCVNTTATDGVCLPTCGDASQCGGRACDPESAICTDTPNTGRPTGAACDADENPSACAGKCVLFETGATMCSSPCVLGGVVDPDGGALDPIPDQCGGPSAGLCAFHPVTNGPGDTGYCTPSCSLQSDCQAPAFFCFGVAEVTPSTNKGYCFAATACPNGQSDCTGVTPDAGADAGAAVDAGAGDDAGDAGSASDAGSDDDAGGDLDGGADADASDGSPPDPGDAGSSDGGGAGVKGYVCTPTPLGAYCLDPRFPLGDLPDAGDAG